jgi:phospholipase C
MRKIILFLILSLFCASCAPRVFTPIPFATAMSTRVNQSGKIPNFEHIVLIILENQNYQDVIGSQSMPYLNSLAQQNVLLSNYFAVSHPSLPNYIALVSGSTQNIQKDCTDCFIDQPNLADLIEASGRTWKTYQEDMPSPCFIGNAKPYYQKHNPFIYFDSIRLNADRCQRSILPLSNLDGDLAANQLPNFAFIMPNICNSGHDCPPETSDAWVKNIISKLQASPALGKNSLIISLMMKQMIKTQAPAAV